MADSTYYGASGEVIYGGVVPSFNDVVDNVWTPTKKANGHIYDGSWNGLPLDTMVEVSGTQLMQIRTSLLNDYGFDITSASDSFGSSKNVNILLHDWSAPALDKVNSRLIQDIAGGHGDSSAAFTFCLELETMGGGAGLKVLVPPVDPDDPVAPWSLTYKQSSSSGGSFTEYKPHPDAEASYWPDYIPKAADTSIPHYPTARHGYGTTVFIPTMGAAGTLVTSRISQWMTDLATGVRTRLRFNYGGIDRPIDTAGGGYSVYDAPRQRLVGNFPRPTSPSIADDLGIIDMAPGSNYRTRIGLDGDSGNAVGSPVSMRGHAWTWFDDHTILAIANNNTNNGSVWGLLYLDAAVPYRDGAARALTGGMAGSVGGDFPALAYSPGRKMAFRRLHDASGTWRKVDFTVATAPVESAWSFAGKQPPADGPCGGRLVLYKRHDGHEFLIWWGAVSDTANCVHVMRLT